MLFLLLAACADKSISVDSQPNGMVDADGDGYLDRVDCDDSNAGVHPGAADTTVDGVDQDCDGTDGVTAPVDSGDTAPPDSGDTATHDTGPTDRDGDGYLSTVDCNDTNSSIHPGATEIAGDGIDQDCNGSDDPPTAEADVDGDHYASEAYAGTDCDDTNPAIHPGATETARDGIDSDCDGADFAASALTVGNLVITEIMYDPDAVSDSNGEWFELYNASGYTVNLKGLAVADDAAWGATDVFTVDSDVIAAAGARVVFAVDGDPATNGGINADFDYQGGGVNLNNATDQIYVGIPAGRSYTTLDSVSYDELSSWPIAKGASIELNDAKLTTTDNDRASNWCLATSVAGSTTDRGSPGKVSSGC